MRPIRSCLFPLCCVAALVSCGVTRPRGSRQPFRIIGYMSAHTVQPSVIPYGYLTHINYAFAIPDADRSGALLPVPRPDTLRALVRAAHAQGVKVFISVGGWGIGDGGGNDSRFEVLAASAAGRRRFTASLMALVREFGLDGTDIDWEYPDPIEPSRSDFVALMRQLGDSLHAAGRQLSAAIVSGHDLHGYGISEEVFGIADWLNIMAYDDDYNSFGGAHVPHAPYWLALRSFEYWVDDRGLPPEKAVMGVPFYGKRAGRGYSYRRLLAMGADPYGDVVDSIYYNGISTLRQKTALAMRRGAGIMIWEIAEDTTGPLSLLKAVYDRSREGLSAER